MCNSCNAPIGIFDSGVGGISVLCTATKHMPKENFIYYADNKHAPYGTQTISAVKNHSFRVAKLLIEQGVKAIVVACNTATSAAIIDLRQSLPVPVIGMEPALKPAVKKHDQQAIIVLATPMTLANKKFNNLLRKYGQNKDIISLPAPKLVELVEKGAFNTTETRDYLMKLFKPYLGSISSIVLGCTHFLYARNIIHDIVGTNVVLVDGNIGTVRQLNKILVKQKLLNNSGGNVVIQSSGDNATLALCHELYKYGLENLNFYK